MNQSISFDEFGLLIRRPECRRVSLNSIYPTPDAKFSAIEIAGEKPRLVVMKENGHVVLFEQCDKCGARAVTKQATCANCSTPI